jgi:hypothetical protein
MVLLLLLLLLMLQRKATRYREFSTRALIQYKRCCTADAAIGFIAVSWYCCWCCCC